MLKLDDIKVTIKGFIILRGVSLEIPDGGMVGLVGPNGAGKTTTLKSIMGLVPVWDGSIRMGDVDLKAVEPHLRARLGIGYMPEERRLTGALSVEDNIMLPAWASNMENAEERLKYIYDRMPDLVPLVKRRATMLSGGQQKLAALARAVMSGTKLLLLDEPFEGLSPGLGDKLAQTIRLLQQDGISVLMAESDSKRIEFAEVTYEIERGENVENPESVQPA